MPVVDLSHHVVVRPNPIATERGHQEPFGRLSG
jgi:hypothetical protein